LYNYSNLIRRRGRTGISVRTKGKVTIKNLRTKTNNKKNKNESIMKNKSNISSQEINLRDIFNKFAKRAFADFPQLKDNFLFYAVPTRTTYTEIIDSDEIDSVFEDIEDSRFLLNYKIHFALKADGKNILLYESFSKYRVMTGLNDTYSQEVMANLEHELGHLIAPGGYKDDDNRYSKNFGECVGDVFSFMRLQEEYKDIRKSLEATAWISTRDFIFNSEKIHFTAPALNGLNALLKENKLPKLSPIETANAAYRVALKYALSEGKIERLSAIFEPVREANKVNHNKALNLCAEIMLQEHGDLSQDVFSIVKTYIEPFINRDATILGTRFSKKELDGFKLKGKIWDRVLEKIKLNDQEKKLDKLDYLELLGAFDENKSDIINPKEYETAKNRNNIKRARKKARVKLLRNDK